MCFWKSKEIRTVFIKLQGNVIQYSLLLHSPNIYYHKKDIYLSINVLKLNPKFRNIYVCIFKIL